jgi:hypothetical protein
MPHGTPVASRVTHEKFIHRLNSIRDRLTTGRLHADGRTLGRLAHRDHEVGPDGRARYGITVASCQPKRDSDAGEFARRRRDGIASRNWRCGE